MEMRHLLLSVFVATLCACSENIDLSKNLDGPGPQFTDSNEDLSPTESTEIGNGGDLIYCSQTSPRVGASGWFVLDFIENRRGAKHNFIQLQNLDEHIVRIGDLVKQHSPELVESWEHYVRSLPFEVSESLKTNELGVSIQREWIKTAQNENVEDENPSYIPRNCYEPGERNTILLHQVIVRKDSLEEGEELTQVKYHYDEALIEKIGQKPLQMSMLIVHEWLWDLFPDEESRRLRSANRWLHSTPSSHANKQTFRIRLNLEEGRPRRPKGRF